MDAPTFTGCIVEARLIVVLEAEQSEEGQTERNDRLIAVATESMDYADLKSFKDLNDNFQNELEHFFVSYNHARGKEFKVLDRKGAPTAWKLVEAARIKKPKRTKK